MSTKLIIALCAAGFVSGSALAQTKSAPQPPAGPTDVQCQQGWKEGSQWSKEQFTQACDKLRQSKKH